MKSSETKHVLHALAFHDKSLDVALRTWLYHQELPKATEHIDQLLRDFAEHYHFCNSGLFPDVDAVHTVAFSLLLLQTDAHNPQIKRKMSKPQFLKRTLAALDGRVASEVIQVFYDNIVYHAIESKWVQSIAPSSSTWFSMFAGYPSSEAFSCPHQNYKTALAKILTPPPIRNITNDLSNSDDFVHISTELSTIGMLKACHPIRVDLSVDGNGDGDGDTDPSGPYTPIIHGNLQAQFNQMHLLTPGPPTPTVSHFMGNPPDCNNLYTDVEQLYISEASDSTNQFGMPHYNERERDFDWMFDGSDPFLSMVAQCETAGTGFPFTGNSPSDLGGMGLGVNFANAGRDYVNMKDVNNFVAQHDSASMEIQSINGRNNMFQDQNTSKPPGEQEHPKSQRSCFSSPYERTSGDRSLFNINIGDHRRPFSVEKYRNSFDKHTLQGLGLDFSLQERSLHGDISRPPAAPRSKRPSSLNLTAVNGANLPMAPATSTPTKSFFTKYRRPSSFTKSRSCALQLYSPALTGRRSSWSAESSYMSLLPSPALPSPTITPGDTILSLPSNTPPASAPNSPTSPTSGSDCEYVPTAIAPKPIKDVHVKGRNVDKACNNCKKSHLRCDEQRPCRRCIVTGKGDCKDVEHKPRGRPRLSKKP
ncbi:hypothetical protein BZG36_04648 [Bifiguratus adelaidae]|uniref:Zn(2)-C6 fungal-type domain-containing protein n=1 Tax=Bifiguratus adelaidae TaxID=1938954 RepID=A0A261XXQ8_9FUNG|nr:hypothetical protein BZG36_04648 [Bifiguratus adelaidae]